MNRRGFALLTVLWVLAILGLLVAGSLRLAEIGGATSRNRIALTRAGWAREACLEILLSRYAGAATIRKVDTVDLGRGAWCRAELEDAGARLDLNLATPTALRVVLGNDSLADALLDWRDADDVVRPLGAEAEWYRSAGQRLPRNGPLADPAELRLVRGFGDSVTAQLAPLLTARGTGRLNLNSAPPSLLATLPGFGAEAVSVVSYRRLAGERIQGVEHLAALLSPPAREELLAHFVDLSRLTATEPAKFTAV
ncbi:MAG: type II secretion system protein GspK, partial [Gemmatimonadota bacterium]|nr:type II secretion system protein GspK [Gemmatimonadota bacterium]